MKKVVVKKTVVSKKEVKPAQKKEKFDFMKMMKK